MVLGSSSKKRPPIKEHGVRGISEKHGSVLVTDFYEQVQKIGEGGQGKIWIVKRKSDKKVLVRKEQKRFDMHGDIPCEMHIFENVLTTHPRIIEFDHANYISANGSLVLYFEHCQGGDLNQYIPKGGASGVSENFIWRVFIQLADALAFLHYGSTCFAKDAKAAKAAPRDWMRIIHRDIKPANVFLRYKVTSRNSTPEVVLGDFGLATLNEKTYGGGTDEWIGPEIPLMTKQNDVWGVGAIIHALAHGKGPVSWPPRTWPKGRKAEDSWYRDPKARRPMQLPTAYSSALNRNMMDCLVMDPRNRINSQQLVKNLEVERPKERPKARR